MKRREKLNDEQKKFWDQLVGLYGALDNLFSKELHRSVSFGDVFVDRWERANRLGFGANSSIYDSSLVIGDVKVGENCWIGPYTILDGSGGLYIGDFCTISAGVQIYTHDNVKATLSSGVLPIERLGVAIGHNTYIAPNVVISKGVKIGHHCIVATGSFVNKSFPECSILAGIPAKIIGKVVVTDENINLEYY